MARHTALEARTATALTVHDREVEVLRDQLRPADFDEAKPILAQLFSLPMQDGTNDEAVKASYRLAVSDHPLWAIKEVVAGFLRGRIGNGFCPNSAELGKELDRVTNEKRARWSRARKMADEARALADNEVRRPMSDETRKFAAETIARLKAASEADRAELRKPAGPDLSQFYKKRPHEPETYLSRPLTPEDVADIPDAPKRGKGGAQPVGNYMPFGGN